MAAHHGLAIAWVVLVILVFACSSSSTKTQQLSLGAGDKASVGVDLSSGDVIQAEATIVGDQSVDIGLWLEDPDGKVVVPEQRGHNVSLKYGATSKATYHVIVDNSYSLVTGKVVSLKITVN
jgi:hypothetical protein